MPFVRGTFFARVDLAELPADVAEMFDPLAEERGIHLVAEVAGPVVVAGDPSRLRQLVTNLVDNAIRFTGPDGSVVVRVEGDAGRATLRVRDTGIGILAEHLPHIFERFYQVDPARTAAGGLGLSICRWIAQAHGGSIGATGGTPRWAEFVVTLPAGPATCKACIERVDTLRHHGR